MKNQWRKASHPIMSITSTMMVIWIFHDCTSKLITMIFTTNHQWIFVWTWRCRQLEIWPWRRYSGPTRIWGRWRPRLKLLSPHQRLSSPSSQWPPLRGWSVLQLHGVSVWGSQGVGGCCRSSSIELSVTTQLKVRQRSRRGNLWYTPL